MEEMEDRKNTRRNWHSVPRQPLASCNRYGRGTNVITAYVQHTGPAPARIRSRRKPCAVPNPIKWPIRCPIRPRLINAAFLCTYRGAISAPRSYAPPRIRYRCFVAGFLSLYKVSQQRSPLVRKKEVRGSEAKDQPFETTWWLSFSPLPTFVRGRNARSVFRVSS